MTTAGCGYPAPQWPRPSHESASFVRGLTGRALRAGYGRHIGKGLWHEQEVVPCHGTRGIGISPPTMRTVSHLPVRSIAELISGFATELDLDSSGIPRQPLLLINLAGSTSDADIMATATAVRSALAVTVGIVNDPLDDRLSPLLDALTFTLAPADLPEPGRSIVRVPDVVAALTRIAEVAATSPQATIVATQTLRASEQLDIRAGLAAEAAAYSMLLSGREFANWLEQRGPARAALNARQPVTLHRDATTLSIRLDRPGRRNAMDRTLREALVEGLLVALADESLQVELSGAGLDFCSGGDLDEFGTATDLVAAYLVRLDRHPGWLLHQVRDRATVRLQGACIGAGIEIPAFADRVIAEPGAFFVLPEVGMGLIPGAGGTVSIPRRIGRWRTAWLALSGERLDVDTALAWGLVDEVNRA